jgi:NADH-quinone oxidoreductase subunit J
MTYFHTFLCFLLLVSSLLVTISKNPVQAVIFLVLSFLISGITLMLFHSEFFGIAFIIIYVGAIAVLFVFIIMMLEVKRYAFSLQQANLDSALRYGVLVFICISLFFYFSQNSIQNDILHQNIFSSFYKEISFDFKDNIDVLGQSLYNYYLVCVLVGGIILLVALIGAIYLTFRYDTLKLKEKGERQLARSENTISYFRNTFKWTKF